MSRFRTLLTVVGLSVFLTASVMASVTLIASALRDRPRLGLIIAASVFLTFLTVLAVTFRQRK